jgi:hypothetical protein
MKFFWLGFFLTTTSWAGQSLFVSSVEGITIGNTHVVTEGILRGAQPGRKVSELADYGIEEVIIFKSQSKNEVDKELVELKNLKIKSHHIPFRWKDLESTQVACEQTVKALQLIRKAHQANRKIFFHCTVGEDRTGLLAGLWRMEQENLTTEEAWQSEMCQRGYADGNPKKPWIVTKSIHEELTPLFLALAEKIEDGEQLDLKSCLNLVLHNPKKNCRQ